MAVLSTEVEDDYHIWSLVLWHGQSKYTPVFNRFLDLNMQSFYIRETDNIP
jgi:hypothetical protein